ncbi:zinc finger BED domain-containing protein RICESLEEPER 2-like [Rhizophagus irregularis DAOM 181602=DAOM 197198]|nr:zinc finger BED domain-containing protein RICESLEEPER 2-like [Rhizophagus irregularis DAOM 181602=DAOM 197198]
MSSSDSSNNTNNDSIINIGKDDESSVKKRVSPVYQYFTFNDELSRWYCDYCAKDFGDNTSNLWRHIKRIHSEILGESEKTNSNNNEKPTQHGFQKKLLQWPSVNVPSANTLRRDLSANFEQVKDKVRLELQETPGLLFFTVDAWTSKNQLPFLGISVHWINKKCELQSLTLDFCLLSGQHSGENLAQQFLKVLEDFNIETKLLAIGCDNASNMDVMLNKISSSLRSKNISFNPNNQRQCVAIELPELELLPDIKTPLHNFTSADRDLKHYLFSDNEWKLIEEIHSLMQYFKICSDYITGQLYPTLAFTIPAYNYLLDKIEDIIDNNNIRIEIKNATTAAKNKIEEYYPTTGGHIYIIATAMDP